MNNRFVHDYFVVHDNWPRFVDLKKIKLAFWLVNFAQEVRSMILSIEKSSDCVQKNSPS